MKRTTMLLLRTSSAFVLGLFLIEAFAVDGNGCLFGFGRLLSHIIFANTVLIGIAIGSILMKVDRAWRVLHVSSLAVYVAMLLPIFLG